MAPATGRATTEGTRRFLERASNEHGVSRKHFRTAPVGIAVTTLGLGTYIGSPDTVTDAAVEEAARQCLASGRINVLDTAINYRYQRAERSLGRAITGAIRDGAVQRDEFLVATKVGYFAPDGESSLPADRWVEHELVETGVLDPKDIVDGCHAMSVSYLKDQFERSQANLRVATVDLLYLHNGPDAQLPIVGREEFLRRLSEAFELYERLREEGKLQWYGLATWDCLRTKRSDVGYFALESAVAVARKAGGEEHGFRFLQFPFNLVMAEAVTVRNQPCNGDRLSLFEAAQRFGLGCFTSVPLGQGQLARHGPTAPGLTSAQTAIQFARSAPGNLAPLIGQKRREHLEENLRVAELTPWGPDQFQLLV